jgi:hypothetical protein
MEIFGNGEYMLKYFHTYLLQNYVLNEALTAIIHAFSACSGSNEHIMVRLYATHFISGTIEWILNVCSTRCLHCKLSEDFNTVISTITTTP